MSTLNGKGIIKGKAAGEAMVTRQPINFTAAHTKPKNLIPGFRSEIKDRHHELVGKRTRGKVLVFPSCIGSTYTGLVLLELAYHREAPAAMVVQNADSLLVSGTVLAETWFERGFPIVEYNAEDLYGAIGNGDWVEVDGATGEIRVDRINDRPRNESVTRGKS